MNIKTKIANTYTFFSLVCSCSRFIVFGRYFWIKRYVHFYFEKTTMYDKPLREKEIVKKELTSSSRKREKCLFVFLWGVCCYYLCTIPNNVKAPNFVQFLVLLINIFSLQSSIFLAIALLSTHKNTHQRVVGSLTMINQLSII